MLSRAYQQASDDRRRAAQARPGEPAAVADEPPPAGLRGAARRAAGRRPAGSTRRWAAGRWTSSTAPFTPRRTVYGFIDRQNLPGLFRTFDFASPDTHQPAAAQHDRAAAGAVPDEQPVRRRAGAGAGGAAGRRRRRRPERAHRRAVPAALRPRPPTPRRSQLGAARSCERGPARRRCGRGSSTPRCCCWQRVRVRGLTERVTASRRCRTSTGDAWQGGTMLPGRRSAGAPRRRRAASPATTAAARRDPPLDVRATSAPSTVAARVGAHRSADALGIRGAGSWPTAVAGRSIVTGRDRPRRGRWSTVAATSCADDTLDFVVDGRRTRLRRRLAGRRAVGEHADGRSASTVERTPETRLRRSAGLTPAPSLTAWEQYAQVLL